MHVTIHTLYRLKWGVTVNNPKGRMVLNGTNGYQDNTGTHTMTCTDCLFHYEVDRVTDQLYLFEDDGTPLEPDSVDYKIVSKWWEGN